MFNTRDEIILSRLKKDFKILTEGLKNVKTPFVASFDAVSDYMSQLKNVVKKIKKGIIAKDDFCYYTIQPEEIPEMFVLDVGEEPVSISQKCFNFFVKHCYMLEKGIEGLELNQIDFDKVLDVLERLEYEINEIKQGHTAKDLFVSYGSDADFSEMFAKKQKR